MSGVNEADFLGRLKKFEGRAAATAGVGKDLVNEPMIRHWCEAMGDTNAAYTGPDAIAPPTMLQAWTMGGLSGHGDGSGRTSAYDELFELLDGAGFTSVVATDCEQEYVRDLRPGDRITYDAVIESVSEPKTTKLGAGHFVTTRMDVRANGALAGTHRFRILKYAPAQRNSRSPGNAGGREGPGRSLNRRLRPGRYGPGPSSTGTTPDSGPAVAEHRLLIQRCGGCAELRFPWLPGCHACGSAQWDTVEASGSGTVFSYVVMHHPPFPAFDPPYAVGLIELAEGVRMISNVVGVAPDEVRIGMPVRLEFQRMDDELELPVFRTEAV